MKMIRRVMLAILAGAAAFCGFANYEDCKAVLDHITAPREAIDLGSTNEWLFATVLPGTDWNDKSIKWRRFKVPSHQFWRGGDKGGVPNHDYYRRAIVLNSEQAKKGGALFFELIAPHYEIRFNGKSLVKEEKLVGTLPRRVDVSGLLREGTNLVEVALFRKPTPGHLMPAYTWGWQEQFNGISRPVHFELYDRVFINDVRIVTKVSPKKTLLLETLVTNTTDKAVSISLEGTVEGTDVKIAGKRVTIPPHASHLEELRADWADAKLWNPDEPNLYYARVCLTRDNAKEATDTLRQRFGFREVGWSGTQLTLNGNPMLMRRETFGFGNIDYDSDKARKMVAELKHKGYNSSRCSTEVLLRDARIADEEGYMLCPLAITGGPYERWDAYWSPCSNLVENLVKTYRNHPSITHWSLFNEFGPKFGVPLKQSPKTAAIGEYAMMLDPTRFWVSTGDYEMSAEGPDKTGPTKMRSLHYPINLSWGLVPDVAYWLANDGDYGAWQLNYKKPVGISEDLYHGMNDHPQVMGQWAGDKIYTPEGYCEAWREVMEMFCDGYYYSGLSEWNPWATDVLGKFNKLYEKGPIMPDFHISRRHAFPNVLSGSEVSDSLFVFNQRFVMRTFTLHRLDTFNGKKVAYEKSEITIPPGGRFTGKLSFTAPKVTNNRVGRYCVSYVLTIGEEKAAKRKFDFNVVAKPEDLQVARKTILIDYTAEGSPLRSLFKEKNVCTNSAKAVFLAGQKGTIVVAGAMPGDEGAALDKWVFGGGRAVLFIGKEMGWTPLNVKDKCHHNFAWRRTASFLPDVDESLWSVWRPQGRLSTRALEKDATLDLDILLDHCVNRGFQDADVVRVSRNNGGSWLVTSLPIEECAKEEPAAMYLASRLVGEQEEPTSVKRMRSLAFADKSHPYIPIFKQNAFPKFVEMPSNGKGETSPVVMVDGNVPMTKAVCEKILSYAKSGGIVFVTETGATNRPFLARLGLGIHPRGGVYAFKNHRNTWHWTTPLGYRAVIKEPYYKPQIISGAEPFTKEQIDLIYEKVENAGQIAIEREHPDNRALMDMMCIRWREANLDWFTRIGRPDILAGISNNDLYFSKLSLDRYNCWAMRKNPDEAEAGMDMYAQTPNPVSLGCLFKLTGAEDELRGVKIPLPSKDKAVKDVILHTYPAIFGEVIYGKGRVIVLTLDSANFRGKYPQKFLRFYRQLLGNLGVRTSTTTNVVRYKTREGVSKMNYRLWDDPKQKNPVPVLFENGEDLRYFPVNQRGWSLAANNECPVEDFPVEAMVYGGIPFKVPYPNFRNGASVCVDPGGYGMLDGVPNDGKPKRVWMLAAMDKVPTDKKVLSGEKPAISFTWIFEVPGADGKNVRKRMSTHAYYGREIGAYMNPIAPTGKGRIAWEGFTGTGKPAVLYAFPIEYPQNSDSGKLVGSHYTTCGGGVKTAIFALTYEME